MFALHCNDTHMWMFVAVVDEINHQSEFGASHQNSHT